MKNRVTGLETTSNRIRETFCTKVGFGKVLMALRIQKIPIPMPTVDERDILVYFWSRKAVVKLNRPSKSPVRGLKRKGDFGVQVGTLLGEASPTIVLTIFLDSRGLCYTPGLTNIKWG